MLAAQMSTLTSQRQMLLAQLDSLAPVPQQWLLAPLSPIIQSIFLQIRALVGPFWYSGLHFEL